MAVSNLKIDFGKTTGRIKPIHGWNCAPYLGGEPGVDTQLFKYMKEASIPYSRLHDVGFFNPHMVDIPGIFPDFDADETDPASYDFTFTDLLVTALKEFGAEPFYRLGISIENAANIKAYHVLPPRDYEKWARISEHIIRHYNEGWANGFTLGIRYWELWFEPDVYFDPNNIAQTWHGTRESYFSFYDIVSKHLKKVFGDSIQVGGYAGMGFKEHQLWDPELNGVDPCNLTLENRWAYRIDYFHKFLQYVREHDCPLDFYSWHAYSGPKDVLSRADYCRRILNKYGFEHTPDFLDEWNTITKDNSARELEKTAADTLAMLIGLQKSGVSLACYYIAAVGSSVYHGIISPSDFKPYKTYFAFKSFGRRYELGEEVAAQSDDEDLFVLGARNEQEGVILLANISDTSREVNLNIIGANADTAPVILTDKHF
ncbi:MAG: hypothetical protein E7463_03320 [Ruminococcaceae bacterium]|nr:hypothetical protein [Oscillospiraceae bacterium]